MLLAVVRTAAATVRTVLVKSANRVVGCVRIELDLLRPVSEQTKTAKERINYILSLAGNIVHNYKPLAEKSAESFYDVVHNPPNPMTSQSLNLSKQGRKDAALAKVPRMEGQRFYVVDPSMLIELCSGAFVQYIDRHLRWRKGNAAVGVILK